MLLDDNARYLGFAGCTKATHVIDSKGRKQSIGFYRYLREWRASLQKPAYTSAIERLDIRSNQARIGPTLSKRLKKLEQPIESSYDPRAVSTIWQPPV